MIGNDIVDLHDSEAAAAALHPRFDARVFTATERQRIHSSEDPHQTRWMLWAAKESAYKLFTRQDPTTIFAHSEYLTSIDRHGIGSVSHNERSCRVSVMTTFPAVHVIAIHSTVNLDQVIVGARQIPVRGDERILVRRLAAARLAEHLGLPPASVTIAKNSDRIPTLLVSGRPRGCLSLSHHGAWTGFAWAPASHTR